MSEKKQFGGNHYLGMEIQPRELAMSNGWDADAFSCLKYLSRYERKNGADDLRKARHFAEMRRDFNPPALLTPPKIRISDYLHKNGFDRNVKLKYALRALWDTVYVHNGAILYSEHLIRKIDDLLSGLESEPISG